VSLYHIDFSRQLLDLVPRDLAEKHCLVPIFVRRVRGIGETLYVAMDDPSNEQAQTDVAQYAGLPVRPMIAPPADIKSAIRVYYAGSMQPRADELSDADDEEPDTKVEIPRRPSTDPPAEEEHRSGIVAKAEPVDPPSTPSSETPERADIPGAETEAAAVQAGGAARAKLESAAAAKRAAEQPSDETPLVERAPPKPRAGRDVASGEAEIAARETDMPAPKRGARSRMITLTLLDGTQVNLPARDGENEAVDADEAPLTARDLVTALRAASQGADASEVLGDVSWQRLVAALLSVLMKKHLVADWEFIEELQNDKPKNKP
jgi:type IV pilus assembly protein PilB